VTAVERLTAGTFAAAVPELAGVLCDAVEDGASVGFLAGLSHVEAQDWWRDRAGAVAGNSLAVWVARDGGKIQGTISLAYAEKANARHRADVIKLAVVRARRGQGLGRRLLQVAEDEAAATGISLLMLDTETDSAAEALYRSAGWERYGIVPGYAADPAGTPRDCSFYFKRLGFKSLGAAPPR
jgi:GNAT superfamily N-acetyltransferase